MRSLIIGSGKRFLLQSTANLLSLIRISSREWNGRALKVSYQMEHNAV